MKSLGHKIHMNFPGVQHVLETFTTSVGASCFEPFLQRVSESHAEFIKHSEVLGFCQELMPQISLEKRNTTAHSEECFKQALCSLYMQQCISSSQ